jgi:pilus assembly protein CpaC
MDNIEMIKQTSQLYNSASYYDNEKGKKMRFKSKTKWILAPRTVCIFMLSLLLLNCSLSVHALEPNPPGQMIKTKTLNVIVGHSTIIKTDTPTIRVAVTDPEVAEVKVLTPYQVLLQGTSIGMTDLIIWSEDERHVQRWKVYIEMDLGVYEETLQGLFPYAKLELSQSNETLIIKGLFRDAEEVVQLHDYLDKAGVKYVDMTSVAGVHQVQLEVRIAEVSKVAIKALGINWLQAGNDFLSAVRVGSESGGALVPSLAFGPDEGIAGRTDFVIPGTAVPGSGITVLAAVPRADLTLFIKALAEDQFVRILANPTLVALSGEEASFLAGGEFPIPVVQGASSGAGGGNSITIEYKEFGVQLLFRPMVLGDGTIRLYVAPEVSELTDFGAVIIEGFSVPSLITRRAETTLELKSGQTFAMAGLLRNKSDAINSRVPFLGDIPILGTLFRSVRYKQEETELVVMVTATLVEPLNLVGKPALPGDDHKPPNDWAFYLNGSLAEKVPPKVAPADAARLKDQGLNELAGPGAWESYGQAIPASQANAVTNFTNETLLD